jgi:tripartite-type tricarboxylate transporter receptor subunit TctC
MNRLILLAALVAAYQFASAQEFPVKPVRILVGNPPGGTADLIARQLATHLSSAWRQSVIVDNRVGASGIIATDLASKAAADGYTLLVSAPGPLTTQVILADKLPYDPLKDLTPITVLAVAPSVLMVSTKVPAKTVAELIALAKGQPGKLNYASSGTGNPSHLHGAMLASYAGIDIVHVPYRGGGPAVSDLAGGHVEIMFNPIPAMLPLIQANRVRALAVTSKKRFAGLPDVPTLTESGLPQIESIVWYGALAPRNTPPSMVKRLHTDLLHALSAPETTAMLTKGGAEAVGNSPTEFSAFLRKEIDTARKLLTSSGAARN